MAWVEWGVLCQPRKTKGSGKIFEFERTDHTAPMPKVIIKIDMSILRKEKRNKEIVGPTCGWGIRLHLC